MSKRLNHDDTVERLLEAPCVFCAYSGAGYWQSGTHAENCPWRRRGGVDARARALPRVLGEHAGARQDAARLDALTADPHSLMYYGDGRWQIIPEVMSDSPRAAIDALRREETADV